jgi:hypothetical protein
VVNRLFAFLLVLALTVGVVGCSGKPASQAPSPQTEPVDNPPVQSPSPSVGGQTTTPEPKVTPPDQTDEAASSLQEFIPFQDAGVVRAAISAPSAVTYRVVNVGATEHPDLSAYLDDLMAKSNWPGANDLVLVVFAGHNNDIRFGMGSLFRQKGVTVEEILSLVRTHYLPEARKGEPEMGLANLIGAVNRRMN